MKIKNYPYEFINVPTIGDGNCLIHAILNGCNKSYKKLSYECKVKLAKDIKTTI